ncbi:hypothetical protein AX16_002295 [Volvariella volvacea WC 439]|nr:hypothetical protein AX16_002295 [Volvariella volvacea WC 439]
MSEADIDCKTVAPSGDISGRGVRLSFYIQGACLIISALYSRPDWGMVGTATPYAVTGIAYAICTMVLGFIPEPEVTIYDAIISNSLGGIALLSVLTIALIFHLKYDNHSKIMRSIMAGQALVLIISAISVTVAIPNFGLHPECFKYVYWMYYGRMRITMFRTIHLVFYSIYLVAIVCFILFRFKDHIQHWMKTDEVKYQEERERKKEQKKRRSRNYGYLIGTLIVSAFAYVLMIVYIEVLRHYNRTLMAESDGWSFGQIISFSLCILPVMDTMELVARHKREVGSFDPMVTEQPAQPDPVTSPLLPRRKTSVAEDHSQGEYTEEPEEYRLEKSPGELERQGHSH